jgi:hypothetical protein
MPIFAHMTLTIFRNGRMGRVAVLMIVALCQMPVPVVHDHGAAAVSASPAARESNETLLRHLALFHSASSPAAGWHFHLIPPAFWLGGAAGESTGTPAPEADGGSGVPVPSVVSADAFVPSLEAWNADSGYVSTVVRAAAGATSAPGAPLHASVADRVALLGVMLC